MNDKEAAAEVPLTARFDSQGFFVGHKPRICEEHRTVGAHRAWCFDCSEWCYPDTPCELCKSTPIHTYQTLIQQHSTDRIRKQSFSNSVTAYERAYTAYKQGALTAQLIRRTDNTLLWDGPAGLSLGKIVDDLIEKIKKNEGISDAGFDFSLAYGTRTHDDSAWPDEYDTAEYLIYRYVVEGEEELIVLEVEKRKKLARDKKYVEPSLSARQRGHVIQYAEE